MNRLTSRAGVLSRLAPAVLLVVSLAGCRSIGDHRERSDRTAASIIGATQRRALGETEAIRIESPEQTLRRRLLLDQDLPRRGPASLGVHELPDSEFWRGDVHLRPDASNALAAASEPGLPLNLLRSLQIAAQSSREFQAQKEGLFKTALALDLERDEFRSTFAGLLSGEVDINRGGEAAVETALETGNLGITRRFRNGIELSSRIVVDLVQLLTQDTASSLGLLADASVSIPLLRGSGRLVSSEPLTQAEQNMLYALYGFERFKRTFAVRVAGDYLGVLRERQQLRNVEENYKRLVGSTRLSRRLADSGRLPEFQYDQAVQDELRARTRWIEARQNHASRLDAFKMLLGLPPDAHIDIDEADLARFREVDERFAKHTTHDPLASHVPPADAPVELQEPDGHGAGPLELDPAYAIQLALEHRLDLRTAEGRIEDAQRGVTVAADGLRAELTLLGRGQAGERRTSGSSAGEPNAKLDAGRGTYSVLLNLDLPLERTAEQSAYRNSLIELEQRTRDFQETEDQVKLEIRNALRTLLQARENITIQLQATKLAEKRVHSTDLFLQAGRAQIRDVLDAQEALLNAQNALTSAVVSYRLAELSMQRDLGLLQVSADGLWKEFTPEQEAGSKPAHSRDQE